MSQQYKSKYDQLRENSQSTNPASEIPELSDNGPVRNICFELEDGSMTFLNYGYLISGNIDAEREIIILNFTTHEVKIKGCALSSLFYSLMKQTVAIIKVIEKRYNEVYSEKKEIILTIDITKREN